MHVLNMINFFLLVIAKNVSNETTLSNGEFQSYFKMFVKVFIPIKMHI